MKRLMGSRFKFTVICSSFLLTILMVIGAVLGKSEEQEGAYRPLAVYTEVLARIKSDYVEEPDIPKVTQGALQGLVEYLDPLSSYLTAEQFSEYQMASKNSDNGTGLSSGMVVHKQGNYTSILAVLPGSPADQAGIQTDDLIDAIDGMSTRVMSTAHLHTKLSGEPGSSLTVMIRPVTDYDLPVEHTLERTVITLPDVDFRMLHQDIGYVDTDVLSPVHIQQTSTAIKKLEADGARKIILDLRGNAGGSPEAGIDLANLFLDSGTVVALKGQKFSEKTILADAESKITTLPLVVLINRPTTGGAEIAAAAIQKNQRGEIVGEKSLGLAAKQDTILLEDGAALILSIAKYYGPEGDVIHQEGVSPDHAISPQELRRYHNQLQQDSENPSTEEKPKDPFLEKAFEVLSGSESA